nr:MULTISPECIES: thioredoxin family protein [Shouchella]
MSLLRKICSCLNSKRQAGKNVINISYSELRAALDAGKDGWVYVHSPFCGACKKAEQMLSIIEESKETFSFWQVNIQLAPEWARSAQIESVPALLYYKKGRLQAKMYRLFSVMEILSNMKEVENDVNGL